jgi:hypothetical protein
MQKLVTFVGAIESVLVGSANGDRIAHALTPICRRVGGRSNAATNTRYFTRLPAKYSHLKRLKRLKPLYPTPEGCGFYGLLYKIIVRKWRMSCNY